MLFPCVGTCALTLAKLVGGCVILMLGARTLAAEPPLEVVIPKAVAEVGGLARLPPETQKRVNKAIDRGVEYLQSTQVPFGYWTGLRSNNYVVGFAALPGITLLESGVPPGDPAVQKAAEFVRKMAPNLTKTYEISLAVLFLDRLGEAADNRLIRSLTLRLVAGQSSWGGWSYHCPVLQPAQEEKLLQFLRQQKIPKKVLTPPDKGIVVTNNAVDNSGETGKLMTRDPADNSNTQFAVLAAR